MIIIDTDDVLLVCPKHKVQSIKDLVKKFQVVKNLRSLYEFNVVFQYLSKIVFYNKKCIQNK